MTDYIDWEDEEDNLIPEDWTEEDIDRWNKFLPFLKSALFESTMDEIRELEALPDVEFELSDDFKRSINKIFRDAFGENCKVPHPEVDDISETTGVLRKVFFMEDKKIIDITGVELTPGNMKECLGNGEHFDKEGSPIECCCDECDYMILCLKNADKHSED